MAKWSDDVYDAINRLGNNEVHLSQIYNTVCEMRNVNNNDFLQKSVRATLGINCEQSKKFRGNNLFISCGQGYWGLA